MLTKEIEVDETYVTHCRKGRKIEGHPGKKRGTPARKRGLSKEKICILTEVQRSGNCIARSFNVLNQELTMCYSLVAVLKIKAMYGQMD